LTHCSAFGKRDRMVKGTGTSFQSNGPIIGFAGSVAQSANTYKMQFVGLPKGIKNPPPFRGVFTLNFPVFFFINSAGLVNREGEPHFVHQTVTNPFFLDGVADAANIVCPSVPVEKTS
jgi:hypothetical protein